MRTALVTGASTGIGEATALRLERAGWTVLAGVRSASAAQTLRDKGSERLQPVQLDVTDPAQIAAAADGLERLDALVNNAGIGIGGPLEALPVDELRRQFDVNVFAQVAVTQAFLPAIRAARGRIAFVGSVGGSLGLPFTGPYNASKFALEAIAQTLRQELKPWGIGVTLVAPGAVATPIWGKGDAAVADLDGALDDSHRALYAARLPRMREILAQENARGIPPDQVAAAIESALTASRAPEHVRVGRDAKIQYPLARVMPKRVMEALIAREMKL